MKDPHKILCLIHERLNTKIGFGRTFSKENLIIMLGATYHIPKYDRQEIIDEMVEFGMIEIVCSDLIKVNPVKVY